jgi:DNA-directed RNA polymerase subunit RPC12/RpoP
MAMKKAEMEAHASEYQSLMAVAKAAESQGLFREAVNKAVAAWDHIDGMMQYGIKYAHDEYASVTAIDLVLKYAPLLFDFQLLDSLELLLESQKRIEKNTSHSMTQKLSDARAQMWDNHRLWAHLERNGETRQDQLREQLGGNQDHWRWLSESWGIMGLIDRRFEANAYRLALSTRMGQVVQAKCPGCGKKSEAPKAMFLEKMACPDCHKKVLFVLLSSAKKAAPQG